MMTEMDEEKNRKTTREEVVGLQGTRKKEKVEHEQSVRRNANTATSCVHLFAGLLSICFGFCCCVKHSFLFKKQKPESSIGKNKSGFFGKLYDEHSLIVFDANKQEKIRRIRICFETI